MTKASRGRLAEGARLRTTSGRLCFGVLACTFGCGRVGFDPATGDGATGDTALPALDPDQIATSSQAAQAAPLHVYPSPTRADSTLVLVAAIDTASQHIDRIYDDGGNGWQRLLDGSDAGLTGRVEIWWVARSQPITDLMLQFVPGTERALAVQLTEWSGIAATSTVVGLNVEPAGQSTDLGTGVATVGTPALVIGAIAFQGAPIIPALDTPNFTGLEPFGYTNVTGATAYRVSNAGDHEVRWTVPDARYFTGGVVALRIE